jgi:hypothetical protein
MWLKNKKDIHYSAFDILHKASERRIKNSEMENKKVRPARPQKRKMNMESPPSAEQVNNRRATICVSFRC